MCPNCILNNSIVGMIPGYIIAFFICILFFGSAVVAMFFASRHGKLDDLEETKFRMLED